MNFLFNNTKWYQDKTEKLNAALFEMQRIKWKAGIPVKSQMGIFPTIEKFTQK